MVLAHPEFSGITKFNDIGIIQLDSAANFKSKSVKPICLPFTTELQTLPSRLIVIGWGRTAEDPNLKTGILQKAAVPLYDQEKCRNRFTEYFTQKKSSGKIFLNDLQFCAGGEGW
jgi:Trypsin